MSRPCGYLPMGCDGVCAFWEAEPVFSAFKRVKPFMMWSGKNRSRVCCFRRYLFVCHGKKGKTHCIMASAMIML